jgi:hypothetical protein
MNEFVKEKMQINFTKNMKASVMMQLQGCGAGASRSQNFWPEPELEPGYRSFGSGSRLRVSLSILKKSKFILNRI